MLAGHLSNVFYNINGLVQRGPPLDIHLHKLATYMTTLNRSDIVTDADGYAPIVGTLAALLLTQSTWQISSFPDGSQASHGPVRWQTYGSGPRLGWEWVAAVIIFGVILVSVGDLVLLFWKRVGEPRWAKPGALLEVKRQSLPITNPEDERWFLRESGSHGSATTDQVLFTNDEDCKSFLRRGVTYKWRDD